jgi:cytochrome P450 family 4
MGISINAQDDVTSEYVHSVKEMCRIIMERALSPIQMFDLPYFFTKNYRIQRKALRILHEKSNSVIKHKREELEKKPKEVIEEEAFTIKKKKAFIDLILEATVDGRPLTQEEIRQEVDTFMFAVGNNNCLCAMSLLIKYCRVMILQLLV